MSWLDDGDYRFISSWKNSFTGETWQHSSVNFACGLHAVGVKKLPQLKYWTSAAACVVNKQAILVLYRRYATLEASLRRQLKLATGNTFFSYAEPYYTLFACERYFSILRVKIFQSFDSTCLVISVFLFIKWCDKMRSQCSIFRHKVDNKLWVWSIRMLASFIWELSWMKIHK